MLPTSQIQQPSTSIFTVENSVENSAENPVENPVENSVENSAENPVENEEIKVKITWKWY